MAKDSVKHLYDECLDDAQYVIDHWISEQPEFIEKINHHGIPLEEVLKVATTLFINRARKY